MYREDISLSKVESGQPGVSLLFNTTCKLVSTSRGWVGTEVRV